MSTPASAISMARDRRAVRTGRATTVGLASLVAFAAAALAAGLGRAVTTSYLPVLLDRAGTSAGVIGTVMLVNAAAGFAVPLVVGLWSDRLRARGHGRTIPFIFGGSLVAALGLAAVALGSESSFIALALFGAVTYVGLNAMTTAHRALVPEGFGADERAKATGAQEFAMLVGGLAGVAAGGLLVEASGWLPFALAAAALPLLVVPTVLRMHGRERGRPAAGVREQHPTGVREQHPTGVREQRPAGYYFRAAIRPGVRELLAAQILWVLGYAALPSFFILYAERVLGLKPSAAAAWLVAFGVATGATMLLAGRARRPERHRPLLLLGVVLMGGGFLATAAASSSYLAGPGLLGAAVGFGLVSTIGFPLYSSLIPQGEAGGYTALYFSVRAVSSAVALPAAGWAIAVTGSYRALFVLGGAVTFLALAPLARLSVNARTATAPRASARRLALPARRWLAGWAAAVGTLFAITLGGGLLVGTTTLSRLDETLFRAVNQLGPGPELLQSVIDPHTRNYAILTAIAVAAAAWKAPRLIPHVLALVTLSWLLGLGLHEAVHAVWNRPRPEEVLGAGTVLLDGRSWGHIASFPSGHLVITTALVAATTRFFPWLRAPLWTYIAAVAVTRVLFGAHFPTDVVFGLLVGYGSVRAMEALLRQVCLLELPARLARPERPARCPRAAGLCLDCPEPA